MISTIKTDVIKNKKLGKMMIGELRGLSTDEKPTTFEGKKIGNGSIFIEIDTGKIFFYDLENEQWKEI